MPAQEGGKMNGPDAYQIRNLTKRFGNVEAVVDVGFSIARDEFFALLGPSGSGKTTLLRLLSGLETPDAGSILIEGRDVTRLPPYLRNIGMVFQDFLLLPHRTVAENIVFPLRMQRMNAADQRKQLDWVVGLVHLDGLEDRYPHQLSGGQKQRTALARGLVARPSVLLLDEPLANLDRELRKEMEVELRRFQKELNIPFIYVTHNQEEALTMSDRVAVMNRGRLEQEGRTMEIYDKPATSFVASFVGTPNRFQGRVESRSHNELTVDCGGFRFSGLSRDGISAGDAVDVYLKSERIRISRNGDSSANRISGRLRDTIFKGQFSDYFVKLETGQEIVVSSTPWAEGLTPGAPVVLNWSTDAPDIFRR
jgi:ABC-type Fe3+/spermidine/putrescine transport system ATPase subunit